MICRECIESYWIKNSQVIDMAWDVPPTRCSWAWHLQGLTAFMQSSEEAHGLWVAVRQRKCPGSARGSAAVQQCGSAALHGCLSYLIIRVIRGIRHSSATSLREQEWQHCPKPKSSPPRWIFCKKTSHVEASSEVQYLRSFLKHSAYSAFCNILDLVPICANLCLVNWYQFSKVEMLENLQDKANSELNELRAKEVLKQSRHVHCQTPTEAVVFVAFFSCSICDGAKTSFLCEPVCKTVSGLDLKVFPAFAL